jgi:uncharacterized protein YndB with AHSA1/START domain
VEAVEFRTTVTFEDLGNGRTRLTLQAVFPSAERERVVREYGADKGAVETLARLGNDLAQSHGSSRLDVL